MNNRDTGNRTVSERVKELNRLGEEWSAVRNTDEVGRKIELEAEVFECAALLFKDQKENNQNIWENGIGDFFSQDWKLFDASLSKLYDFMNDRLRKRARNSLNKDKGIHRVKKSRQELEDEKRERERHGIAEPIREYKYVREESLDAPVGEEDAVTLGDTLPDPGSERTPHEAAAIQSRKVAILTVLFHIHENLHGRANNPERRNYFRMFNTDSIVELIHDGSLPPESIKRQREMFEAMKVEFLDFFMRNRCRTAEQILASSLKTWGEMVAGRPAKEPKQPLPNDVYLTYLNEREGKALKWESTISNQRDAYTEELRRRMGDYLN